MKLKIKTSRNEKLKTKYRFVILNDETFEELFSLTLTSINVWVMLSTVAITLIFITTSAIIYTPLKYFIPGFGDYNYKSQIIGLQFRIDSLENDLNARKIWLESIGKAMNEHTDQPVKPLASNKTTTAQELPDLNEKPKADAELRQLVEKEENYSLNQKGVEVNELLARLKQLYFAKPVNGYLTEPYNANKGHYGIDLAAPDGEPVKAAYDGTVISAFWDVETGYNILIQHNDNLLTVYKHCGKLLKKTGNFVTSGETIALVGNTGEFSTGSHLHFEIWKNGLSLDPKELIAL